MKLFDRIIVSADEENKFFEFFPIVVKAWKKFFPEISVSLALVSSRKPDDPLILALKKFGEVILFPRISDIPSGNQAKISRFVLASYFLDEVIMIEDIDTIPLQRNFVENVVSGRRKGELLSVGSEVYENTPHAGKFPISNITAEGSVFREIINPNDLPYVDLVKTFVGIHVYDEKEAIENEPSKFSDESLLRVLIKNWGGTVRRAKRDVDIHRDWIDRSWWGIDKNRLNSGKYVCCNFLRPFLDNLSQFSPIIEYILGDNKVDDLLIIPKLKILIIQENGRHEENRTFRECFSLQRALLKLGHLVDVWGLNHDNFDTKPDFNSYDLIVNLENYEENNWLPDLSKFNYPVKMIWSIDAHVRGIEPFKKMFAYGKYDLILQSTLDFVDENSVWFPNAFDNDLIKPNEKIQKKYNFGFCGSTLDREQVLNRLEEKYGLHKDINVLGNKMIDAICSYKSHFNRNIANDINYRSFETIGCGTLLITNYNPQYEKLGFVDGENCFMYKNYGELDDIFNIVLSSWEKAEEIAKKGKELSQYHTYDVRAKMLMQIYAGTRSSKGYDILEVKKDKKNVLSVIIPSNERVENLIAENNFEEASILVREILHEDPVNLAALSNYSLLEYYNNNISEAIKIAERVLELSPEYEIAKDNLEVFKKSLGNQKRLPSKIKASAIVSMYKSEKFIRGCIEDLINQTLYKKGQLELVLVNSGSPENEDEIIREYLDSYDNIKYIKTKNREGVYTAWNRGIKAASGKYITNANTDDRHKNDALEIMFNTLERNDKLDLVYADSKFTTEENKSFDLVRTEGYLLWPEYDLQHLFQICFIGPHPMWRKSLHEQYGYFDEDFITAGDYEFWLRIARKSNILHISKILGVYLYSSSSIEHQNEDKSLSESNIARNRYWRNPSQLRGTKKNYLALSIKSQKFIEHPKVSIIIPTYNRPNYLIDALDSLANQTYKNFEVIVINDGTINIENILEKYDSILSIVIIQHTVNLGRSISRNHGISIARGEYIGFLDDDDVLYKYHIELLLREIENKKANVVYADAKEAFQKKDGHGWIYKTYSHDFLYKKLLVRNIAPIQSFLIKKSVISKLGGFDINLNTHEDWELWIRIAKEESFIHLKEVTSEFRKRSDGTNTTSYNLFDFLYTMRFIYKKYRKYIHGEKSIVDEQTQMINSLSNQCLRKRFEAPVSIIIVTYNSAETIHNCIESVIKTKRKNDEIIIIDNASTDNTLSVLQHFHSTNNMKIIVNNENLGFSKAVNQGIKSSHGAFVCLLNPDVIVFKGWLEKMIFNFDKPSIGAVGPLSNYAAGLQNIKAYSGFSGITDLETLQNEISDKNKHKFLTAKILIGFCLMLRRDILDVEMNGLDDNLFLGNDDLDLSWRLRLAGYRLKIALDVFVLHEGQHSFNSVPKEIADQHIINSTNEMYKKLCKYYGTNRVPTPENVWGIKWFNPANANFIPETHIQDVIEEDEKIGIVNNYFKFIFTSVIIPVYNQPEYTLQMLKSLGDNTELNYELIIIDNNSNSETQNIFTELEKVQNIKIIHNSHNVGFPAAINQGLKIAEGDYVVIANNDILLTKSWLKKVLNAAESDSQVGIVGVVSNLVSGVQRIKNVDYSSVEGISKFAQKVADTNRGKIFEFPRVAFLCTLIKREVIDKIGGLDERFSPGNYEDDDFCLRSQLAGFKTVIAQDVFIHHFGSKSFKANGENQYDKLLEINKQKFIDKWGATSDDIWLHGKNFNHDVEIYFPLKKESAELIFNKALKMINKEDYKSAIEYLNECLNKFDEIENKNINKNQIIELEDKICKMIDL